MREAKLRQTAGGASATSVKQATTIEDLSPETLVHLHARGAVPITTRHGVVTVGYLFRNTPEAFDPWLLKFNSTAYDTLFSGLDSEGLRGVAKRSLDLSPEFTPRKIRFKAKGNPMEIAVLKSKISKGILEYFYGAVKSNNRWFLVRKTAYPADDIRGWRLVVDITANKHIYPDSFPLPSPPNIVEWLANFVYTWKADATEAYSQKKMTNEAKAYLVMATPVGNVTHSGQPQGLVGSQPSLLRDFAYIYQNIPDLRIYVDNFFGGSHDLATLHTKFFSFLDASVAGNVKLTIGELEYATTSIEAVGYDISLGKFSPSRRLTDAMSKIPIPKDAKALKSFLASVNVLRNHIPNYNDKIAPLSPLARKNIPFDWGDQQQSAYNTLRDALLSPEILKPFDPKKRTRLKTDYNGFENNPLREPALGYSLWQLHGTEWFPCGYGSRFLRVSEKNLLKRESIYSSSIGESLAFDSGLNHFYPELSQVDRFEVLCDARNLTYWRTSDSPLLVRLRAKVAGKFDISKITLRHIPRQLNFSDSLGRLAQHPLPSEEDLSLSTYEYSLSDLLDSPISSSTVPDHFLSSDFSMPELEQLREQKIPTGGPIVRNLHGRHLFLVPESSRTRDLWDQAHLNAESGAHNTLSRTRARLSHLHWRGKSSWVNQFWRACPRCIPARASHSIGPIREFSGEAMRPTHFGQVVSFDTAGPKLTADGTKKFLATALDGHTGLFDALVIDKANQASASSALQRFCRLGKVPEIALFDRAKAYLASSTFRDHLASKGIDARYSKGYDPRYILGLERIHQEFNVWHRSLDQPDTWEDHIDEFIYLINSAISILTGLSRSGLALGHGPAEARAIAHRHATLLHAKTDAKALPPPRLTSGQRCLILANPKSKDRLALHAVELVEFGRATSLVMNDQGSYYYTPTRNLRSMDRAPQDPPPLPPVPEAADAPPAEAAPAPPLPEAAIAPPIMRDDRMPSLAIDDRPPPSTSPQVHDWLVYKDGKTPFVGVVTSVERRSVHIHAFAHSSKLKRLTPCWTDSQLRDKLGDHSRAGWFASAYVIDRDNIIAFAPRDDSKKSLPLVLKKAIAEYSRDPFHPEHSNSS